MMGVQLGGSLAGKLSNELASTSSAHSSTKRSSTSRRVKLKFLAVIVLPAILHAASKTPTSRGRSKLRIYLTLSLELMGFT
jgi:hypothetical protein